VKFSRFVLPLLAAAVVLAVVGCGKSTDPTGVNNVQDSSAPAAPAGLDVMTLPEYNELTWETSTAPDVDRYQVYEYQPDPSRDNAYVLVGETTSSSWRIPGDDAGTETHYRVRAVDTTGNRSALSDVYDVSVPALGHGGGGTGTPDGTPDGRKRVEE